MHIQTPAFRCTNFRKMKRFRQMYMTAVSKNLLDIHKRKVVSKACQPSKDLTPK
jgi:hypothetical protein